MKKQLLLSILSPLLTFAQPGNDECSNAITVPMSSVDYWEGGAAGTLAGATASPEAAACTGISNNDIWFTFAATNPRHEVTFTGGSTAQSLVYAIYEGSCSGTLISCGSWGIFMNLRLENLTPGLNYYIRLYSVSDAPATTAINVHVTAATEPMQIHTGYTPQELAETFFFEPVLPFVSITGAASSTGSAFGEANGIAGFSSWPDNFPLEGGIVLTTGDIGQVSGHNEVSLNAGTTAWGATTDFEEVFDPEWQGNFANESSFEFDFHLPTDMLEFSYVFASEGYGADQCLPSDAFAIILTDLGTNAKTNLAVIPGSILPVNTNTVRDNAYNLGCPSENSYYFGEYYIEGDTFATTNFNGHTGRMDVSVPIVPYTAYHIKFVIADREGSTGDSALFVSWTFNIGEPTLAPTAISPQQFTEGETLADIEIEGEGILWYSNIEGGEPLPADTILQDGITYYATQTIAGLESQNRTGVQVFLTLNADENGISGSFAYPNPVKDILYLTNASNILMATLQNHLGVTIKSYQTDGKYPSIDLSGLASGMYFVKLISDKGEKTIKIMKQ